MVRDRRGRVKNGTPEKQLAVLSSLPSANRDLDK